MPQLMRAHLAGLYAVTGNERPTELGEIEVPEYPDEPDIEAFLADARCVLRRLYEELETALTDDPDFADQLRRGIGAKIARDAWWRELREDPHGEQWWRNLLEDALGLYNPEERSRDAEYNLLDDLTQDKLIRELLNRMDGWPPLQGDRQIPMEGEPLLQLDEEAVKLLDRYRNWEPETEQILRLIKLVREDPNWRINDSQEHKLVLWRERLKENGSGDRPTGEFVRAVQSYARWLRFPSLPSPRPDFFSGTRKQAARALLATTLPGDVNVRTLENYLSRARSGGE